MDQNPPMQSRNTALKVLLFTAHFGDGHRQVATALRSAFERAGVEVLEIDCMRSAHPKYARWNEASFELTTKYFPIIYGLSYTLTRRFPNNSFLWKMLSAGARRTAENAVTQFTPDAVLQLFPEHILYGLSEVLEGGTAEAADTNSVARPVSGVVLTDFSIHSRWFCPNTDVYYLPHESLLQDARQLVPSDDGSHFLVSGIPLREQFSMPSEGVSGFSVAEAAVSEDGRNGSGVGATEATEATEATYQGGHIVVATGGRGVFGGLKDVLTTLYDQREGRDVVVMCGRNVAMRELVEELAVSRPGLKALPFVEQVAPWLRTAAYAVVKPGGVTVAECLSSGCPMLFYRPPLGQELDNARWVSGFGAGKIANNLSELAQAASWLSDASHAAAAGYAARDLGRKDAAEEVVRDVISRVEARRGQRRQT